MLGLLAPYYKQLAAALVAVLLLVGAYFMGYSHEKAKLEAYISQVETIGKAQEAHVQQITKTQNRVSKESLDVYKANLAAVKSYYSNGLHISASGSAVSQVSSATSGTDAGTSNNALVQQCAETTVQLIGLQKWVVDQGSIE